MPSKTSFHTTLDSDSAIDSFIVPYMDNAPNCIWCLDKDLRFIYFNNAAEKVLKKHYAKEVNIGDSFIELLEPENTEFSRLWIQSCHQLLGDGEAHNFDMTKNSDFGFSHIKCALYPIREAEGLTGVFCSIEDDSEVFLRDKLQQALSTLKSSLLRTFTINDLLWSITDDVLSKLYLEDALILMKNKDVLQSKAAYGSRRKAHRRMDSLLQIKIGKGVVGSVAKSGRAEIVNDTSLDSRYFKEHFDAGSEIAVPIILNDEVIGVINCESSYKNFFRPIHMEILSDVANVAAERIDQIIKERKYRRIQEYNRAVLNSTPNSYLLLNTKREVVSLNKTAIEMLSEFVGHEIGIGSNYVDFIPPEYHDEFKEALSQALIGEVTRVEKRLKHPNCEPWVRLTLSPAVSRRNNIFGVTVVIEDITADKEAEELILKQNNTLEKSNKELDKFIYSVSHDLRSPVASVLGLTTLIDFEDDVEEIKNYNELIKGSMHRMDAFIKNILDYSRSSRTEPRIEEIDLIELVSDIISDHRYISQIGKIEISKELEITKLKTDRQRLSVVLSNLISNAIKYHDDNKENQYIKIRSVAGDEQLSLIVEDNGLGIEKEHLERLFDMYYTVEKGKKGSGIGLFILKDTINVLGGEVSVDSAAGEGSTFTITLPLEFKDSL